MVYQILAIISNSFGVVHCLERFGDLTRFIDIEEDINKERYVIKNEAPNMGFGVIASPLNNIPIIT